MIIQNINSVVQNKKLNGERRVQDMPNSLKPLSSDVFEHSKNSEVSFKGEPNDAAKEKIKTFKINQTPCGSWDESAELRKEAKKKHIKRNELFGTNDSAPSAELVKPEKFQAIYDVQFETGEYSNVNDKMRADKPLNHKEKKFYDRVVSQMDTTDEPRTLWRMITPYEGFEDEIRSGTYKFKGLTSTSAVYDDFFDFWSGDEYDSKNKTFKEGYILKINVPKGAKILDCNAYTKKPFKKPQYPRMRSEVVLPEYSAQVVNVDNDLNVIEMNIIP